MYLEQVRLYVGVRRVEDEVRVGAARHLGHVLVAVDGLGDVDDLLLQRLDEVLVLVALVLLVAAADQLAAHRPHLPRHALLLERPARAALLEELERDGAARWGRPARVPAQSAREARDLPLDVLDEHPRLAAHVGEVDEVAVDVHVADGADGVALLVVVGELAAGAVEQHRVEDARQHLAHLLALHGHAEVDAARVHGGASVASRARTRPAH